MTAPVELSPPPNGPMLVAEGPERKWNSESPGLDPLAGRDLDALITDPVCQRLFRLFLVFAGDNLVRCPDGRLLRCVSRAQARFLLSQIGQLRDQMQICPNRPLPSVHSEEDAQFQINGQNSFPDEQMRQSQLSCATFSDQVTFRELLGHALTLCPRRLQFSPLVDRLFARYVLQIVRKGFLLCRPIRPLPRALRPFSCCLLPPAHARSSPAQQLGLLHSRSGPFRCRPSAGPWRPFWCVLMPGQLQLWPLVTPKSGKGGQRLPLDAELESAESGGRCWTLKLDKDSQLEISDLDGGGQLFGWLLATRASLVELAHFDQLQRQLWIADLEMVVRKRRPSLLLQFDRLNSRRPVSQLTERRSPSVGKQQLQKENCALVELLEAERRALKDEETVRQLATRMLDEEVQRGDSLRQTVECLASQLEMEREQRQLLEHSIIEQQEQQQQQKQPEQAILSQNSPTGEQNGKLDANDDEDVCLDIPVLVPFDRLITPQPRARKGGKRLRDSIRNKKEKARKELGQEHPVEEQQRKESREVPVTEERGEELKVVNVGPRPPPKPGPKPKRNLEKEQKKLEAESAQPWNEELAENGQELLAGIYDQATLRATDYWDATKPPPQPPNGINAVDANFLMAMSTRSV